MPAKFAGVLTATVTGRTVWVMMHKPAIPRLQRVDQAMRPQGESSLDATLLSIGQTAQLSGVSEADLLGLVEYGVLAPSAPESEPRTFDIGCVIKLQRAALMRHDLALDSHGFALTMMFLNQITGLEAQLQSAQCDLSHCRSLGAIEHLRE